MARGSLLLLPALLLAPPACRGGDDHGRLSQPVTTITIAQSASLPDASRFTLATVDRGDILGLVRASAPLQAIRQANVVTQISGRVIRVFVDVGSIVKKNDVLATVQAGATPPVPIKAPMDGTVLSRAVDPGMVVVASFNAPVLFVLADDLSRMRVVANLEEAGGARVREHLAVQATVDAFPGRSFPGSVSAVHQGPTTIRNTMTYDVAVDLDNPDQALRPGMMAVVTFVTGEEANGAVRVPNGTR
jgi:multidrug efflux pump subunit AcrA (membrane-fusion protein)